MSARTLFFNAGRTVRRSPLLFPASSSFLLPHPSYTHPLAVAVPSNFSPTLSLPRPHARPSILPTLRPFHSSVTSASASPSSSSSSSSSSLPLEHHERDIQHIQTLVNKHVISLSTRLSSPAPIFRALSHVQPPLFAFRSDLPFASGLVESLLTRYVNIANGLSHVKGPKTQARRANLSRLAKEVDAGWQEMIGGLPVEGETKRLLHQRMYPELVEVWTSTGDWEAVGRIAAEVGREGIVDPALGEKLVLSSNAYCDYFRTVKPDPLAATIFLLQLLQPAVKVVDGARPVRILKFFLSTLHNRPITEARSSPDPKHGAGGEVFASAFKAILEAVQKEHILISNTTLISLTRYFRRVRDEAAVEAIWALIQKDDDLLRSFAPYRVPSLFTFGRASEITSVTQLLLERDCLSTMYWTQVVDDLCYHRSDGIGAARFIVDVVRVHGSKKDVLASVGQLIQRTREPGQPTCKTMEWEISAVLEDTFGKDLWKRVEADMIEQAEEA